MKCCHLYEIRALQKWKKEERLTKLYSLDLLDINDYPNLITLCEKCHAHFDNHKIGIHPMDRRWIIAEYLREDKAPSDILYSDIHGRPVRFHHLSVPPLAVLKDRYANFIEKNRSRVKGPAEPPIHYCHFCLETFKGDVFDRYEAHLLVCRVTFQTRALIV
jgi:hypothetical protein